MILLTLVVAATATTSVVPPFRPQDLVQPEPEHSHPEDFETIVEHRAFGDLMRLKERHPWRIGTEVRKFVLRLESARGSEDGRIAEHWNGSAAFLAETLADDAYTPWLMQVHSWDVEDRARFETVRRALIALVEEVPERGAKGMSEELDVLRPPVAPEWTFESCADQLAELAEAVERAGDHETALAIAREVEGIARKIRDGELALWTAEFLGEIARKAGDRAEALGQLERMLAFASELEPLPHDFEAKLATALDGLGDGADVAWRVDAFRAAKLEDGGSPAEALELWKRAAVSAAREPHRELATAPREPPIPDPARRGALAAAMAGREADAWALAEIAHGGPAEPAFDPSGFASRMTASNMAALVEYVVGDSATVALEAGGGETRVRVLPLGAGRLEDLVTEALGAMGVADDQAPTPPVHPFDPTAARELYQALVAPLGIPLRGRVAIVRDGALGRLPFAMLVSAVADAPRDPASPPEARFLVDDAAIAYLESAAGLVTARTETVLQAWDVDRDTLVGWKMLFKPAPRRGRQEIEVVQTLQVEFAGSRDANGSPRAHPWYWAAWEVHWGP